LILGVGVDLCEVSRMEGLLEVGGRLPRLFCPEEIAYALESRALAPQRLASAWAAKEAFAKATGLGILRARLQVCLIREGGVPRLGLKGEAARRCEEMGVRRIWLSVSHEGGLAVCFLVLEG